MRVLLVEDDRMIAKGLRDGAAPGRLCGRRRGRRAQRRRGAAQLDGSISCCSISACRERDGLEVLRELRGRGDSTPVIIVTARDDVRNRIAGLDAGADDYIVKPFDLDEVAARMRSVLRRAAGRGDPCIRHRGISLESRHARGGARRASRWCCRRTNSRCWRRLLQRPGAVLSRAQLEDRLYGWGDSIESNAVEVYMHGLRRKLGSDAIRTLRGVGYFVPKECT